MLTYKISTYGNKEFIRELKFTDNVGDYNFVHINEDGDILINSATHGLYAGDNVIFERNDGSEISYKETKTVKSIIDDDNFSIDSFGKYKVIFDCCEILETDTHPEVEPQQYLRFFAQRGDRHYEEENRGESNVKMHLYKGFNEQEYYATEEEYSSYQKMRKCPGDKIIYNDFFLYYANVDENNLYSLRDSGGTVILKYANIDDVSIYIEATDAIKEYFGGEVALGNSWEFDGEYIRMDNLIVPSKWNGDDDTESLMWLVDDEALAELITKEIQYTSVLLEDRRFFKKYVKPEETEEGLVFPEEESDLYMARNGVKMFFHDFTIKFSQGIVDDFAANMFQHDALLNEYIESRKDSWKNEIIDYEKMCFSPIFKQEEEIFDIQKITFNLHFRERNFDILESDDRGHTYIGIDYGEWKTNPKLFWNNYYYEGGVLVPREKDSGTTLEETDADLLGYLGFTDDDIYYQKKKLTKSFIRLSFYDDIDRRKQNLLFTSTIFVDGGKLYSDYIENIKFNVEKKSRRDKSNGNEEQLYPDEYVFTENARKRLCASFTCQNKYNSPTSSEGFYIYLFKGVLDEEYKGRIYMKVEFNHAKYGYRIPMTLPLNDEGAISPTENFPIDYVREENGKEYVNTIELFEDMYIPIDVEYDEKKNGYFWSIPGSTGLLNGNEYVLNLYEPRINKFN